MLGFKLTLDSLEFLRSKAAFVFFCRGTCFLVVDGCLVGTYAIDYCYCYYCYYLKKA